MPNYQHYLSDEQLERLLEKSAASLEQPPDEVVESVTPWRKAMERIIVGTVLNMVTLNFLFLQFILPAIGLTMLLLGFRALRRENGWFKVAYVLSIYRCAQTVLFLILNATIYTVSIDATLSATAISLAPQFLIYVCLWRGLLAVQKKAGVEVGAPGAGGLVLWNIVLLGLAMVRYSGWLVFIGLVVVYILLLRTLAETSKTLDEAGYEITIAPVRLSDEWVKRIVVITIAAGILLGHFFGTGYRMDWQLRDEPDTAEVTAIKAELVDLGYPEHLIDDLTQEDILACRDARQIGFTRQSFREKDVEQYENENRYRGDLMLTGVAVELEDDVWRIFHHFRWSEYAQFHGTESLQLWPTNHVEEGWSPAEHLSGQVLYDTGSETYTAPFAYLSTDTYTANSFFGSSTQTDIFAGFSLPSGKNNQRGYVAYDTVFLNKMYVLNSWCNYTHQTASFLYPAQTAVEYRMSGAWDPGRKFVTHQYALQGGVNENGTAELW